ncbi:MAG TPA: uridine kinase [Acholeplasmataceae bacterium]|nr:uridine kinase [Acholeplasmataceae bacterium]
MCNMTPLLILVAGGSASGKSTVVSEIVHKAGLEDVLIIRHDDYYKDQSDVAFEKRLDVNYDHPDALDSDLLQDHLSQLLMGKSIEKPLYDFVSYTRKKDTEVVSSKKVIIVEGILILSDPHIRKLSNLNVYVELDDDTRFIRRMMRDLNERGRSIESIVSHYQNTVKPMFYKFVKPSKRHAHVIIPNDDKHDIAVDLIASKIKTVLGNL